MINVQSLKHNLIFIGFSLGVLLPTRLVFSEFVSDHWLGNLGVITAIGCLLIFLIRKNKLGKLGVIFENQLMSSLMGKTGKFILVASCMFLVYFGSTLVLIDRGNSIYSADTEVFYSYLTDDGNFKNILSWNLQGPYYDSQFGMLNTFFILEYAFAITYAMIDDLSQGWVSHLYSVLFVEQIEVVALVFLVRERKKIKKIIGIS